MSILFEPIEIHGMQLRNRFVRSATHDACSNERGEMTDKTMALFSQLAQGGAGLLVAGFAYVHRSGQTFLHQTAIYGDEFLPGLKRLADKVHEYDAKIAIQIAHSGRGARAFKKTGETPIAPSLVENDAFIRGSHRSMTPEEIEEILDAFALAAKRAREAGFDAVQLHGAHSYLFSQFLSPRSNRRTDEWGGTLGNRMRFHLEATKRVRKAVGDDYPLLMKLGIKDTVEDGLTLQEGCQVAQKLCSIGIDAIEISEGLEKSGANHIRKDIKAGKGEAYYSAWAKEVKKVVDVPVILVGGMRSFDVMERFVHERVADCISMCRPFIREPNLVNLWHTKHSKAPKCISCNLCLERILQEEPVECMQERRLRTPKT
jgi:2,4-dienoyl-CoA reductase-like NADH-dependent reductase (Old Yellow Enzyme family)